MWHYVHDGMTVGPVDNARISALIADGTITRETLVWRSGMTGWTKAGETQLSEQFSAAEAGERVPPVRVQNDGFEGFPRPLRGLLRWVRGFLYFYIALTIASFAVDLILIDFLSNLGPDPSRSPDADLADLERYQSLLGWLTILVFVMLYVTGFTVMRWMFRAMKNIWSVGGQTGMSPTMAVVWWFIPFASLWMPLLAMRRIWRGSFSPENPSTVTVPSTLGWWWFFWIGGAAVSVVGELFIQYSGVYDLPLFFSWQAFVDGVEIEQYRTGQIFIAAYLVIDLITAVLLLRILRQVSRRQDESLGVSA
ncbi:MULTISPECIES: DUF4328 domain-containing protein [Hyphobacterium]|uniref:DUF4328 domain-containing protein n=1 Tax=Hyphobacterium vulgare TaxID=1736751 RepID=A0ABV6ZVB3_9PROT